LCYFVVKKVAGIYIHFPFCKQKCHYCNFFSVANTRLKDAFMEALLKEIVFRKQYLEGETVKTIYFGGGTPSLLQTAELRKTLDTIFHHFTVDPHAEITLEANPDDISEISVLEWKNTAINRLSIGIQSFFDDDLQYLNRVHHAAQAFQAIDVARNAGFGNLTIDLIYGIPTLSNEKWVKNLEYFFSLNIPHLSAYSLTVEQKTPLDLLIRQGKYAPLDEQQSIGHFKILLEQARINGFIHYEISNFAREGYYSRHNSLYWLGGHYLGLGPSAHSYNGHSRQWNVSNITKYVQLDDFHTTVEEKEVLTPNQRYNEYVMTSLRTVWGCDTVHLLNVFGKENELYFLQQARPYLDKKYLYCEGSRYFLTDEGKLFADGIAADLFY